MLSFHLKFGLNLKIYLFSCTAEKFLKKVNILLFAKNINKIFSIIRTAVAPLAPNTPREKLEAMAWALWTGIHGITAVAATEKGVYVTPVTAQSYAKDLAITFVKGLREH